MSLSSNLDIHLHLSNFRQLDHYFLGTYKLRFSIFTKVKERKILATPYSASPGSAGRITEEFYETGSFQPSVYENLGLRDHCVFRLEAPMLPRPLKKAFLEVKFLVHGLEGSWLKKYPQDSEKFSTISGTTIRLESPASALYEFFELVFDDQICSSVSFLVSSTLLSYKVLPLREHPDRRLALCSDIESLLKIIVGGNPNKLRSFHEEFAGRLRKNLKELCKVLDFLLAQAFHSTRIHPKLLDEFSLARRALKIPESKSLPLIARLVKDADSPKKSNRSPPPSPPTMKQLNLSRNSTPQKPSFSKSDSPRNSPQSLPSSPKHPHEDFSQTPALLASSPKKPSSYSQVESPRTSARAHPKSSKNSPSSKPSSPRKAPLSLNDSSKTSTFSQTDQSGHNSFSRKTSIFLQTEPSKKSQFSQTEPSKSSAFPDEDSKLIEEIYPLVQSDLHALSISTFDALVLYLDILQRARDESLAHFARNFHSHSERLMSLVCTTRISAASLWRRAEAEGRLEPLARGFRQNQREFERLARFRLVNLALWGPGRIDPVLLVERWARPGEGRQGGGSPARKTVDEAPRRARSLERGGQAPGLHLVILVHGFQGSEVDMRVYKNYLAKLFHQVAFFVPRSNHEHRNSKSIEEMAADLAQEVEEHTNLFGLPRIRRVSFIGHSLGGVLVRAALPLMPSIHHKLYTFLSLGSPHLGVAKLSSFLVNTGMKIYKNWSGVKVLGQLDLTDSPDPKNCSLFRISKIREFGLFRNFILVSSPQDGYTPIASAHLLVSPQEENDPGLGSIMAQMAQNVFSSIEADCLFRVSVDIRSNHTSLDWATGRAPHIELIQNQKIVETILIRFAEMFS